MVRTTNSAAEGFTLVETMIVVGILGLLCTFAVPNILRLYHRAQITSLKEEARVLGLAKDQWSIEFGKGPTEIPEWADLKAYLNRSSAFYLKSETANRFTDSMGSPFVISATGVKISPLTKAMFDITVTGTDPSTFWAPY